MKPGKSETIRIRVSPSLKARLESLSDEKEQTLSDYLRLKIIECLDTPTPSKPSELGNEKLRELLASPEMAKLLDQKIQQGKESLKHHRKIAK